MNTGKDTAQVLLSYGPTIQCARIQRGAALGALVRNIDVRGWKLHLRELLRRGNQTKYLPQNGSLCQAGTDEEMDIVKAMVERTQMSLNRFRKKQPTVLDSIKWSPPCGAIPVRAGR